MHESVRDAFIAFNEPLEGRVHFMYLDIKSLVSTGVGNLLDADDPGNFGTNPRPLSDIFTLDWFNDAGEAASRAEIEEEYRRIKFSGTALLPLEKKKAITRLRISDQSIDELIMRKLDSFHDTLHDRQPFAELDDWPADGQLGLLSMAWAMGPLFRFKQFQAAAETGDWLKMAKESRMKEAGNPGVIPRNVRNGLLFTVAGWMAAPPPGDFSQLIFDVQRSLAENIRSQTFPIPLNLVIGLQAALETLGFDPNGLDGVFGKGTRAALLTFQRSNGLRENPGAQTIDDVGTKTIEKITDQLDAANIAHFP